MIGRLDDNPNAKRNQHRTAVPVALQPKHLVGARNRIPLRETIEFVVKEGLRQLGLDAVIEVDGEE